MTDDLTDLPFSYDPPPPEPDDREPRPCKHPKSWRESEYMTAIGEERVKVGERCRCGHLVTLEVIRRGRSARRAGNDRERKLAKERGGRRVGQYGGPIDVVEGMFATQSKDGPGTFSERYWRWLAALPRTGGRIPRVVVTDGHRSMTIYVTSDDEALHGPEEKP